MYLLDTNCFIYYLNNLQPQFCEWFESLDNSEIYLSNLVLFELLTGYYTKGNQKIVRLLMEMTDNSNVLDYTLEDAILSAKTKSNLRAVGFQNNSLDWHIASQAINNSLILTTFNKKKIEMLPNLKIQSFDFQHL